MANARIARFVTEAAPPQFVSIIRQRASQMLDTIKEDEREFSTDTVSPRSSTLPSASTTSVSSLNTRNGDCFSKRGAGSFMSLWQPGTA